MNFIKVSWKVETRTNLIYFLLFFSGRKNVESMLQRMFENEIEEEGIGSDFNISEIESRVDRKLTIWNQVEPWILSYVIVSSASQGKRLII